MSRVPDPSVRSRWESLIAAQPQSGLPITKFCEQHGISTASFYQWRRRLETQPDTPARRANAPAFVPLDIQNHHSSEALIRVRFECGAVIEIPSSQSESLAGVVRDLAAIEREGTP